MSGGTNYAEVLPAAQAIERYWRNQGFLGIRVWLDRRMHAGVMDGWEIRSNIGPNGYPPKGDAEQVAA